MVVNRKRDITKVELSSMSKNLDAAQKSLNGSYFSLLKEYAQSNIIEQNEPEIAESGPETDRFYHGRAGIVIEE